MTHHASWERDDGTYTKSGVRYVARGTLDGVIGAYAAGAYTVDVILPPGAIVHEVTATAVALWNCTGTAALNVGDYTAAGVEIDLNGYFAAVNLKAANLLAGETISSSNTQAAGGVGGVYVAALHNTNRYLALSRIIRFRVTQGAGAVGTTGTTICEVVWSLPADAVVPTFV